MKKHYHNLVVLDKFVEVKRLKYRRVDHFLLRITLTNLADGQNIAATLPAVASHVGHRRPDIQAHPSTRCPVPHQHPGREGPGRECGARHPKNRDAAEARRTRTTTGFTYAAWTLSSDGWTESGRYHTGSTIIRIVIAQVPNRVSLAMKMTTSAPNIDPF